MNNFVLGKYLPLDSVIHRIDPRAKLLALVFLIVAIFVPDNRLVLLVIGAFVLLTVFLSKLSIRFVISAFKPMIVMLIFLTIINTLSIRTGDVLVTLGPISIYSDALFNTLFIVSRLLLMIMITTILTSTTRPLDLTLGLEYLMKPLTAVRFPTHEVAMMISIALRFIPTIIEETMRIMNSQKSRGVDFEEGSMKEKITAILSLIVPLFSVAFERAYELADAMEARGYIPGAERTRYRTLSFRFPDFIFLFISFAIMAFSIASRFVL